MTTSQLIYYSQPFGFDDAMLNGILLEARRNNARDGLTGALIVRRDLYLQLLEGPEAALLATFARIKRDNRHLAVRQLALGNVQARLFPDWTMRDDPAQSWLWTEGEVGDGALERASVDDLRGVFVRVGASVAA
ncbi:MAG: BLUF domain-containing protein [Sandarakinorhabdus sp.]|nr:BLUF domain-containing protein [Sandarakinorhabdus sp.]